MVGRPIKDPSHSAIDTHPPQAQLSHDFIQWAFAHEELLGDVAHPVEGRAGEGEKVAFQLVAARDAAEAGPLRDVVAAEENTDTADADEDAEDLCEVVAHV